MTDDDRNDRPAPRHGRPQGEDPYAQDPYAQEPRAQPPRGQDPYAQRPPQDPRWRDPRQPGPAPGGPPPGDPRAQHPYGAPPRPQGPAGSGQAPPPPPQGPQQRPPQGQPQGGRPYPGAPQGGQPAPPYGSGPQYPPQSAGPGRPPPLHTGGPGFALPDGYQDQPHIYRPEEGWGEAGYALPDGYRRQEEEQAGFQEPRKIIRLSRPWRIVVSAVVLVVGAGVAVGLPFREKLADYEKAKKVSVSYTTVPKRKAGAIAGTRFVLAAIGPGDSYLTYKAPAGTAAVQADIYYKSPTQQTLDRMSYLEYVFRDGQGRTWTARESPSGITGPGKITKVELQALVPKSVAGTVQPVVRPKQQLEATDDPTQVVREPALVFQR